MPPSRAARLAAAAALGLAAAAAEWVRAAPIEPHLDLKVVRQMHSENFDIWGILITVRGGETIGEIRVDPVSDAVHVLGPPSITGLKSGWRTGFRVQLDDPRVSQGAVRIVQSGPVGRTYELPLDDAP